MLMSLVKRRQRVHVVRSDDYMEQNYYMPESAIQIFRKDKKDSQTENVIDQSFNHFLLQHPEQWESFAKNSSNGL